MRQGQQHRRGRSRNNVTNHHPGNRKGQNPLTRSFESNGPDVKVRGTPAHVAEKYLQLARDAQSSGDHVLAENYLQHAEHYNRIILAYREQMMQQSGEMMNGNGRHQGPRQDFAEGDDQGPDDMGGPGDDMMSGLDQPMSGRHSIGDQPRGDMQPSHDDQRPQHQQRQDHNPRFRDRHPRQDRHDRPEGYERQDRGERHGGDRGGFDRNRERPYRHGDQPGGESREIRMPREPREGRDSREPREIREPREFREPREPREQREHRPAQPEMTREMPPPLPPAMPPPEAPVVGEESQAPVRGEGQPRRRERFGLGADHPDFLRRPVRRPRREAEPDLAADAPPVAPPSADEPTRE